MSRSTIVVVGVLAAAACAERSAQDVGEGAQENVTWTVDAEPIVEIGVLEGPTEYQFTWASPVLRTSDGRILVGEGRQQELRVFDETGRHLRTLGGDGEGPGEFRMISGAWLFGGDSILVEDPRLRRLSVFAPSGDFVRSFPLGAVPGIAPEVLDAFRSDGATLVRPLSEGSMLRITPGLRRDTVPVSIVGPNGELLRVLARLPGNETFGVGSMMGERAFGASTLITAGDDVVYVASSEAFRIERRARDGSLLRVIEKPLQPAPVTELDREEWRSSRLSNLSERSRQAGEEFIAAMSFPETKPILFGLHVDRGANLWVGTYGTAGDVAARWYVFDDDGREIAQVELPDGFVAEDIGEDWILGTVRDRTTGVPTVQLRRLRKDSAP